MTNGWLKRRERERVRVKVKCTEGGLDRMKSLGNEVLIRTLSSSWTASADCEFPVVLVVQGFRQISDNDSYFRTVCAAKQIQAIPSGYWEWQRIQTVIYWEEGGAGNKYVPLNTLCVLAEWYQSCSTCVGIFQYDHHLELFSFPLLEQPNIFGEQSQLPFKVQQGFL